MAVKRKVRKSNPVHDLPVEVYAQWSSSDKKDRYLCTDTDKVSACTSDGGGEMVGVYQLVRVVRLEKTETVTEETVD